MEQHTDPTSISRSAMLTTAAKLGANAGLRLAVLFSTTLAFVTQALLVGAAIWLFHVTVSANTVFSAQEAFVNCS